jgi:hypothetical protein
MDPNAALYNFLVSASDGNASAMEEYCDGLSTWLAKGGFPPEWHATARKAADVGCYGGNYTACLQKVRSFFKECP